MQQAQDGDVELLVELMAEFYAEGGYLLNAVRAANAFRTIIKDRRLGRIWFITAEENKAVGHLVLTLKYAMEYGGLVACLDDLYVRAAWRNRGLATRALAEVTSFLRVNEVRALTVEVGFDNAAAQAAYRKSGFVELSDRQLLALPLAAPTHTGQISS